MDLYLEGPPAFPKWCLLPWLGPAGELPTPASAAPSLTASGANRKPPLKHSVRTFEMRHPGQLTCGIIGVNVERRLMRE